MFGKLKNRLKEAVSKFSKEAEESEDVKEEIIEVEIPKKPQKKIVKKIVEKPKKEASKKIEDPKDDAEEVINSEIIEEKSEVKEEIIPEELEIIEEAKKKKSFFGWGKKKEEIVEETAEDKIVEDSKELINEEIEEGKKSSFFGKIKEKVSTTQISEDKFEEIFWDLEIGLLENDMAIEVIEKIKADMKQLLTEERIKRGSEEEQILERLEKSIDELFVEPFDLLNKIEEKKPFVICMVGINGCGKTTSMAKLTNYFQKNGKSVVLAAADTFRAAAIQQAEHHAEALKVPIISQGYGADPAAVAFDAIKYAKAKDIDIVIIDTAGRLHSNTNLMAELEKLIRVNKPDLKIFVGESITGNDAIEQSRKFNELVGIDGIILTKADVDEKGGAAISVSYVTGKPIFFLGTGQSYDDLEPFSKEKVMKHLF